MAHRERRELAKQREVGLLSLSHSWLLYYIAARGDKRKRPKQLFAGEMGVFISGDSQIAREVMPLRVRIISPTAFSCSPGAQTFASKIGKVSTFSAQQSHKMCSWQLTCWLLISQVVASRLQKRMHALKKQHTLGAAWINSKLRSRFDPDSSHIKAVSKVTIAFNIRERAFDKDPVVGFLLSPPINQHSPQ